MRRALLASMGSSRSFVRVVYRRNSWQDAFRDIAVSLHLQQRQASVKLSKTLTVKPITALLLVVRWQARTIKDESMPETSFSHPFYYRCRNAPLHLEYRGTEQIVSGTRLVIRLANMRGATGARAHRSREAAASFSSRSIPIIVVSLLLSMTAVKACMARHVHSRSQSIHLSAMPASKHCCHS